MRDNGTHYSGMDLYLVRFTNGQTITVRGACAADAGTRALPMIDKQRGDREAVVEEIKPYYLY